jgi:hypothetical protein
MPGLRQFCAIVVTLAVVAGCSASQDISAAKEQVARFRDLMAAQQFGQIYSEASDNLKKTTREQDLVNLLSAIDRKLGAVKTAADNGWKVDVNTAGTSITLSFKTQYERGDAVETFVYRSTGGKPLLAAYNINSTALIIN